MDQATYRLVIEINQIGVWLGMKAVGPQMIAQQSGSVINISSTAGFRGGGRLDRVHGEQVRGAGHDQGRRA